MLSVYGSKSCKYVHIYLGHVVWKHWKTSELRFLYMLYIMYFPPEYFSIFSMRKLVSSSISHTDLHGVAKKLSFS